MKIHIDQKIFTQFPEATIGVLIAENIDNNYRDGQIEALLRQVEVETRTRFEGQVLSEHPSIQAWRKAYKIFKAGDYRCSAENLTKRVLKGGQIPAINPLVDLYNAMSLKYTFPIGGEDLDCVRGDIWLTEAIGNEEFIPLGSTDNDSPDKGEIIYRDDETVLCRKWNWRESDKTKLIPQTTRAVFFIEGLQSTDRPQIEAALADYSTLIHDHCGATSSFQVLDYQSPTLDLD